MITIKYKWGTQVLLWVSLFFFLIPGYAEISPISLEFACTKEEIPTKFIIPHECVIVYELEDNQNVFSFEFDSDPNIISLTEKHANTSYIYKQLNPKPIILTQSNKIYFRGIYLNGPFYLLCNTENKTLDVMLAGIKCFEMKIKQTVLREGTAGLFYLKQNEGTRVNVQKLDMYLQPLFFKNQTSFQEISLWPETIVTDSLMEKLFRDRERNIVVSNKDYEILVRILFEGRSFIKFGSN